VLRNDTVLGGGSAPDDVSGNTIYGVLPGQLLIGNAIASSNSFLPLPGPAYSIAHPWNIAEPGSSLLLAAAMLAGAWCRRRAQRRWRTPNGRPSHCIPGISNEALKRLK
jgi:hypothetical protein